jgi:hypothetical protein
MKTIATVLLLLTIISCSKTPETIHELLPSELVRYVDDPENGLTQVKIIGEYKYELKFCPADYMIANEFRTDHLDDKLYQKRKKDFENLNYYRLRISLSESNSDVMYSNLQEPSDYFSRDSYLAFEFKNQIKTISNDTLPCELYHFVNSHSVTPYADIIMAFAKSENESPMVLINDVVFGSGILKFYFDKENIEKIPSIITEEL